jgi:hypothetical protein
LVEVVGNMGGATVENTFYFTQAGAWALEELQSLADAVDDVWAELGLPLFSTAYTYMYTKATDLREEIALQALQDAGSGVGTASGSGEAANVSFAVKRQSGFTGRSARGRVFLPALSTSQFVSVNHVSSDYGNYAVALMEAIDAAALLESWVGVICSRFNAGVQRAHGVTFPIVTWSYTDTRVDSQRGRLGV